MVLYGLISSLPMQNMDEAPAMSEEEFFSAGESYLSKAQKQQLRDLTLHADDASIFPAGSFARKYAEWEIAFRNSIAKLRAQRLNLDPASYLRAYGSYETDADRLAREAFQAQNPLEREKLLDRARWNKIEELSQGNMFSFNVICAYKLKLEIQWKWRNRSQKKPEENLDLAAAGVRGKQENAN